MIYLLAPPPQKKTTHPIIVFGQNFDTRSILPSVTSLHLYCYIEALRATQINHDFFRRIQSEEMQLQKNFGSIVSYLGRNIDCSW